MLIDGAQFKSGSRKSARVLSPVRREEEMLQEIAKEITQGLQQRGAGGHQQSSPSSGSVPGATKAAKAQNQASEALSCWCRFQRGCVDYMCLYYLFI